MAVSVSQAEKAHKQLDEDSRLLTNRIKLLEQEERRTWRRIFETKRKAELIVKSKQNQENRIQARQTLREQRQREIDKMRAHNQSLREQRKNELAQLQNSMLTLKRKEADQVRAAKEELDKKLKDQELRHKLQTSHQARVIKYNTVKAHQSAEKRRKKTPVHDRSFDLAKLCRTRVKEIADLEQEERDLIQRLQFIQSVQQQAYEELAEALAP